MDATVLVKRNFNFVAMLRPFTIKIDGQQMTKVKNGKECSFSVSPGKHQIEMVGPLWAKSEVITLDAKDGDTLRFECGLNMKYGWAVVILSIIMFQIRHFTTTFSSQPSVQVVCWLFVLIYVLIAVVVPYRRGMMYYLRQWP